MGLEKNCRMNIALKFIEFLRRKKKIKIIELILNSTEFAL